jgi:hypothetical protein
MSFSSTPILGPAQIQNDPVYSLPHLYVSGMNVSVASTTVLAIQPGACRDSSNNIDMVIGGVNLEGQNLPALLYQNYQPPIFINSAVNGANGLDQGTLAASTQYAIYIIGDSRQYNPTAAILSLTSNVAPLLPKGYDSLRLRGFIETDGSSHFVYATHEPQLLGDSTGYYLQPAVSVLSAGDATTFTGVDLNSAVPTGTLPNVIVYFLVTFIPAAVGDYAELRPTGSSATSGVPTIVGVAAGVAQTQYLAVIVGTNGSSHASVDYLVSSSSDSLSLSVVGWVGAPHVAYPT